MAKLKKSYVLEYDLHVSIFTCLFLMHVPANILNCNFKCYWGLYQDTIKTVFILSLPHCYLIFLGRRDMHMIWKIVWQKSSHRHKECNKQFTENVNHRQKSNISPTGNTMVAADLEALFCQPVHWLYVCCMCYALVHVIETPGSLKYIYIYSVLTHWGLVTPFGDIDLGQHWLR